MDAMELDRVGDMLRFIYEIMHRPDVADEARKLLGDPDPHLLKRAALLGRSDPLLDRGLSALERLL